jgi:thiamine transporter ThiT
VIEQNELLTLLVAASVLLFIVANWRDVRSLPVANVCILAFFVLFLGLASTVLEGLFWGVVFNVMEHVCYGLSSLLLASWVWLVFVGARR